MATDRLSRDFDWELLARYLAGNCAPAEAARFEEWLAADGARQREFDLIRAAWLRASHGSSRHLPDLAWARFRQRLENSDRQDQPRASGRWVSVPPVLRLAVAAALIVVAGTITILRLSRGETDSPVREFVTGPGQRATPHLVDGTKVMLSVDSRLLVSPRYGDSVRLVTLLRGEAYFDVHPDAFHPFVVRAGNTEARAIGTAFGVRASEEGGVRVVVSEGRVTVAVRRSDASVAETTTLNPGDLGVVSPDGESEVTHQVAVDLYLGWTEGRLVFDHTPLAEVALQLSKWYDLDIELGEAPLATRRLSGAFEAEAADEVVSAIALSLGLRYEREGRSITFFGPGSTTRRR